MSANPAHLHLMFNHLPIILPACGIAILLSGIIFRSEIIKRVGYAVIISAGVSTIFAFNTGEGAEDLVENINGINKNDIETHEDQAKVFAIFSYILAATSLAGFVFSFKFSSLNKIFAPVVMLFGVVVMYFAYQTGNTGGKIRHPEISSDFTLQSNSTTEGNNTDEYQKSSYKTFKDKKEEDDD